MEAGDDVDVEELQYLLDETEGMPVAMEEADLLRWVKYLQFMVVAVICEI